MTETDRIGFDPLFVLELLRAAEETAGDQHSHVVREVRGQVLADSPYLTHPSRNYLESITHLDPIQRKFRDESDRISKTLSAIHMMPPRISSARRSKLQPLEFLLEGGLAVLEVKGSNRWPVDHRIAAAAGALGMTYSNLRKHLRADQFQAGLLGLCRERDCEFVMESFGLSGVPKENDRTKRRARPARPRRNKPAKKATRRKGMSERVARAVEPETIISAALKGVKNLAASNSDVAGLEHTTRLNIICEKLGITGQTLKKVLRERKGHLHAIGVINPGVADFIGFERKIPYRLGIDDNTFIGRVREALREGIYDYYDIMRYVGEGHCYPATAASLTYRMKTESGSFVDNSALTLSLIGPPTSLLNYFSVSGALRILESKPLDDAGLLETMLKAVRSQALLDKFKYTGSRSPWLAPGIGSVLLTHLEGLASDLHQTIRLNLSNALSVMPDEEPANRDIPRIGITRADVSDQIDGLRRGFPRSVDWPWEHQVGAIAVGLNVSAGKLRQAFDGWGVSTNRFFSSPHVLRL